MSLTQSCAQWCVAEGRLNKPKTQMPDSHRPQLGGLRGVDREKSPPATLIKFTLSPFLFSFLLSSYSLILFPFLFFLLASMKSHHHRGGSAPTHGVKAAAPPLAVMILLNTPAAFQLLLVCVRNEG